MLKDHGKVSREKLLILDIGVHTAGRQYRTISPLRLFGYDHIGAQNILTCF
jgi:hypothetical protein